MGFYISLFVDDPQTGIRDESEFDAAADLARLLARGQPAGLEISAGNNQLIIRDTLDALVQGVCRDGAKALAAGTAYRFVSFAGYDSAEIAAAGDSARFAIGANSVVGPRAEAIAALRDLAGRYARQLQRAFPDDPARSRDLLAFAAGRAPSLWAG